MFPSPSKRNRYPWSPAPTTARTPPFLNPPVDEQEELGQMTGQPIEDQSVQAPDRSGTQYRDRAMEEINTPRQKVGLGKRVLGEAVGLFIPRWGQEIMRPGERERKQSIFTAAELEGQMEKSDLERMEAQRRQDALGENIRSNRATEAYRNQDLGLRNRQLDEMGRDRDDTRNTTRSNRLLQMGAELMTQPREAYPPGSYFTKDPLTQEDIVIVPENQRNLVDTPLEWRQKYPYLGPKIPIQMLREMQGRLMTGEAQAAHDQRMASRAEATGIRADERAARRDEVGFQRQANSQLNQLRAMEQAEANRIEAELSNDLDRLNKEIGGEGDSLWQPGGVLNPRYEQRYRDILDQYDRKRDQMYRGSRSRMRALDPNVQDVSIAPTYRPQGQQQPQTPAAPTTAGGQQIRVRNKQTGQTGMLNAADFDPAKYERIP